MKVALRKESVDRNLIFPSFPPNSQVALRKESVDRNLYYQDNMRTPPRSLSARRAWIEMLMQCQAKKYSGVALRKESVDRNVNLRVLDGSKSVALRKESVDRNTTLCCLKRETLVALRKESVDRNINCNSNFTQKKRRSPQGERG